MQTNNQDTQLPAELQETINKNGAEYASKHAKSISEGIYLSQIHQDGATEWATKYWQEKQEKEIIQRAVSTHRRSYDALSNDYHQAQQENDRLKSWKAEQIAVTTPILDWGQQNKSIKPGESIHQKVLEYAKGYEQLKAENEKLKEEAAGWIELARVNVEKHHALKEKAEKIWATLRHISDCYSDQWTDYNNQIVTKSLSAWNSEQKEGE